MKKKEMVSNGSGKPEPYFYTQCQNGGKGKKMMISAETMNSCTFESAEELLRSRQNAINRRLAPYHLKVEVRKMYKPNLGEKAAYEVHRTDHPAPAAPVVYCDPSWILMTDAEIVEIILEANEKTGEIVRIGIPEFSRPEILASVLPRVLNESNEQDLIREEIPYSRIGDMDLLVIYYLPVGDCGSITIKNGIIRQAGLTVDELQDAASRNIRQNLIFQPLETAMMNLAGLDAEDAPAVPKTGLYVATTKNGRFGAGVFAGGMDLFREFGEKLKSRNLIVFPSSIHELLILPCTEFWTGFDLQEMTAMVREINASTVAKEEVLSNSVYLADLDKSSIRCIRYR